MEIPAAILVVAEIVILFSGIVARYVLHTPLVWSDELASILFLWLAMLGAVVALRRGEHMRMTALVNHIGPARRAQLEAGALAANSVFHLIDILDWNTHADFAYGDNAFAGQASDVDTEGNELFLVNGDGGYGGSWTHWWARLDNSALYLSESKVGSAVGTVNSYVDVDGLNGYVSLEGSVSDGGDEVVLTTLETAEWYSMNWDWLLSGQLNAVSVTQSAPVAVAAAAHVEPASEPATDIKFCAIDDPGCEACQ